MTKHKQKIALIVYLLLAAFRPSSQASMLSNHYANGKLIEAAKKGNLENVKYYLSVWADIHARNEDGHTALHFSAKSGHLGVVKCLLQQGADTEAKNSEGKTPLDLARANNNQEVVQLLRNPTKCIREYFKQEMRQRQVEFDNETESLVRALEDSHRQHEENLRTQHEATMQTREIAFNDEVERRVTELKATLQAAHQDTVQRQQTEINTLNVTIENLKAGHQEVIQQQKIAFETRERELRDSSKKKEEGLQTEGHGLRATIERLKADQVQSVAETNTLEASIANFNAESKERAANEKLALREQAMAFKELELKLKEKEINFKGIQQESQIKINTLETSIEKLKAQHKEREREQLEHAKIKEKELQATIKALKQRETVLKLNKNGKKGKGE